MFSELYDEVRMPNISSDTIITKLNNVTGDSVIQILTATMSTLQSGVLFLLLVL